MKAKLVVPREQAQQDVEDALAYYLAEDAEAAALGFIDALEQAYAHIGRHPATGSPRYAHELNLPGLRSWPLTRYPYLVFYVERSDHVDVWRVLQGQRDIPLNDTGRAQARRNGARLVELMRSEGLEPADLEDARLREALAAVSPLSPDALRERYFA